MDSQERKPGLPYKWLLAIPIQIVINVLMAPLGFWIDTLIFKPNDEYLGHGIPIFSVLMPLFGAVVTLFVIMTAIICTVIPLLRAGKDQHRADQKHKSKSPFRWLLAIPIQLANNILLVPLGYLVDYLSWRSSSTAFEKIGHDPVFAILIPAVGVVVTVLVTIAAAVCTVVSLIRAIINRQKHAHI